MFECAGMTCCFFTYVVVLVVQWGMMKIGLWEGLISGNPWSYLHLAVFQYHCALIFISHVKCMTTQPGCLPRDISQLNFREMSESIQKAIIELRDEVKHTARNVDLDGPTQVNSSTMSFEE